jgi:hypothetical protein
MKGKKWSIYFVKPVFAQFVKTSCTVMLLFFSLLSCSGNESAGKISAAPSDSLQKNIPAAGSGFSCLIDGVAVSGSANLP